MMDRGKVLSSLGQMYSFKNDKEKAIQCFEEALAEFEDNKVNRKITMSYILQLALDTYNVRLYKKYEKDYFDTENLHEQFENIVLKNNIKHPNDFGFFVFVKALKVFYFHEIDDALMEKLYITDYERMGFQVDEHPWQLIYRNLALLVYHKGNKKYATRLLEKAMSAVKNKGITIDLINECSKLQFSLLENNEVQMKNSILAFKSKIQDYENINNVFENCFNHRNERKTGESIISKFRYMYV